MAVNQAVVFTKPVHHININLTPGRLDELARKYFEDKGFRIVCSKKVTGSELAAREVIKQHYLMYSKASCAESISDLDISVEGKVKFESAFGNRWDDEVATGRIITTLQLLSAKGIDAHQLFNLWNVQFLDRKTAKIQDGLLMAYLEDLGCYCINAFYPAMEANFKNLATQIDYYVLEFDPEQISWKQFRKNILGVTDSSKAEPGSFRGQLYADYKIDFPGRDNFVHGSAGPFEAFVERAIHESDFEMEANPIGTYLTGRGVTLKTFAAWKASQSVSTIGELFDATEEKNTHEIIPILDGIKF
ncbi:MAG: hypothetical protein V3V05_05980 [Pontiella sp.]